MTRLQFLTDLSLNIMIEEQQNLNPNSSLELADVIRENLNFQFDQSVKRTLLKESLLKISLDKDFEHIFENHHLSNRKEESYSEAVASKQTFMAVSEQIKNICEWLEDSEDFCGLAYIPFTSFSRLIHILHQKIEGTAIIVTEYPTFWISKMEEIGRLSKLRWGFLSVNQDADDKVRVLELYELKKLKLLFITPSLFKCEEYHEFQCDLLIVGDMHLYHRHAQLLQKFVAKTNPNRMLGLYHTLMPEHYKGLLSELRMVEINQPKSQAHNMIVLKANQEEKFKTMLAYLAKTDHKRILIIVNKRQEAYALNKKLMMESKTSLSLYDYLNATEMNSFLVEDMMDKIQCDKEQEKVFQIIKRINNCEITITKNTDFLRFCNFDIAIYYSFTDVIKFVESCFTVKDKLLMFSETDYHNYRNLITSEFVTPEYLQKVVMKMVEKPPKKQEQSKKRFYSDCIQDKLLDCYTISKKYAEKDEEKVLRMNSFCKRHQISTKLFTKIIESLEQHGVIATNYRTIYEIQIDLESIARMKKQLPMIEQVRRKVNVLNVSTSLQKTIRSILDDLKREGIKFKITEEALQIKILKNFEDIEWDHVHKTVNDPVTTEASNLDKSFETFKDCAYSSIELTRREKALQKKEVILNFFKAKERESANNVMDSYHKSNLLTSEIEEWLRHAEEVTLTDHDLVLMLQGVEKARASKFKQDPIFGRYRRLKYEELMEAVSRLYCNKKIKLD